MSMGPCVGLVSIGDHFDLGPGDVKDEMKRIMVKAVFEAVNNARATLGVEPVPLPDRYRD